MSSVIRTTDVELAKVAELIQEDRVSLLRSCKACSCKQLCSSKTLSNLSVFALDFNSCMEAILSMLARGSGKSKP